jgi:glycosyltransferase involved in cell wall biosynthesis
VLGSVLPSKGVLELVHALRDAPSAMLALDVHGDLPSYHGDDSYTRAVRDAAARDPRVVLHGPFERSDLPRVLASLDAVAAPALWNEVFGLSVREARAAGLPVLVSDRGGLASAAQDGRAGLVLPASDRAAWTRALERLATDSPSRARWSSTPHELRDIATMIRDVESHYIAAITEVTGVVPPFSAAPAPSTSPAAPAPPKGLLRRLFGR